MRRLRDQPPVSDPDPHDNVQGTCVDRRLNGGPRVIGRFQRELPLRVREQVKRRGGHSDHRRDPARIRRLGVASDQEAGHEPHTR